jgi:hypothetical protein
MTLGLLFLLGIVRSFDEEEEDLKFLEVGAALAGAQEADGSWMSSLSEEESNESVSDSELEFTTESKSWEELSQLTAASQVFEDLSDAAETPEGEESASGNESVSTGTPSDQLSTDEIEWSSSTEYVPNATQLPLRATTSSLSQSEIPAIFTSQSQLISTQQTPKQTSEGYMSYRTPRMTRPASQSPTSRPTPIPSRCFYVGNVNELPEGCQRWGTAGTFFPGYRIDVFLEENSEIKFTDFNSADGILKLSSAGFIHVTSSELLFGVVKSVNLEVRGILPAQKSEIDLKIERLRLGPQWEQSKEEFNINVSTLKEMSYGSLSAYRAFWTVASHEVPPKVELTVPDNATVDLSGGSVIVSEGEQSANLTSPTIVLEVPPDSKLDVKGQVNQNVTLFFQDGNQTLDLTKVSQGEGVLHVEIHGGTTTIEVGNNKTIDLPVIISGESEIVFNAGKDVDYVGVEEISVEGILSLLIPGAIDGFHIRVKRLLMSGEATYSTHAFGQGGARLLVDDINHPETHVSQFVRLQSGSVATFETQISMSALEVLADSGVNFHGGVVLLDENQPFKLLLHVKNQKSYYHMIDFSVSGPAALGNNPEIILQSELKDGQELDMDFVLIGAPAALWRGKEKESDVFDNWLQVFKKNVGPWDVFADNEGPDYLELRIGPSRHVDDVSSTLNQMTNDDRDLSTLVIIGVVIGVIIVIAVVIVLVAYFIKNKMKAESTSSSSTSLHFSSSYSSSDQI